jgi:hypothetical protein
VLYLYAITEHPAPPLPAQPGHEDAPLEAIAHDGVAAVASALDHGPPAPGEEALWRHEAVAEALMADRPVLPVRFGTAFATHEAVEQALAERAAALRVALHRVEGHVEMGVRARLSEPRDEGAPASGTAYLEARLALRRRAEEEADAVHVPLAALATAAVRRLREQPVPMLAGAYLVPAGSVADFAAAVDRLAAEHPGARVVCTGPWPPYSFAEGLDA